MNLKTPKFNKTIGEILDNLESHIINCLECGDDFDVVAEDIEFYKKLQVPPPTLCPRCRMQRRLGYRVTFFPIFYRKSCAVSKHKEKIISYYSEQNSVKVYDDKYYFSDQWEATEFWADINLEKSFFGEYKKFSLRIPHQSLFRDPQSVNSDYVISGTGAKDCYYVAVPHYSEKVYYSSLAIQSKDSLEIRDSQNCEQCFACQNLNTGYRCVYCVDSKDCLESAFLYDCKNCQSCFMSSNLRNKKYVFRNRQLSKEEYQEKIKEINIGSRKKNLKYKQEFQQMFQGTIKKNVLNIKTENVLGDSVFSSKNCYSAFNIFHSGENIRYVVAAEYIEDSMDIFGGPHISLGYESSGIGRGNQIKFSMMCRDCLNIEYSAECSNCENCFACFGLKNKKYHIFNKAYAKKEYWQKVDELKTKMLERGEYGEFFPLKDSPFPYQDSNAQVEFPLTKKEIKAKGWHWQGEVESNIDLSKIESIEIKDIPDDIKDVGNDILSKAVICERSGKPFKILPYELEFYRKMNVPLPTIHPLERVKDLFKYRRPYKLYQSECSKCQKDIQIIYDPKKIDNVYCEKCYNENVI